MNDVHVRGYVRSDWRYRADLFLRLELAPSRGNEGDQQRGDLVVRIPSSTHRGMAEFKFGQLVEIHGFLEAAPRHTRFEQLLDLVLKADPTGAVAAAMPALPKSVRQYPVPVESLQVVAERWELAPTAPRRRRPHSRRPAAEPQAELTAQPAAAGAAEVEAAPEPIPEPTPEPAPEPAPAASSAG